MDMGSSLFLESVIDERSNLFLVLGHGHEVCVVISVGYVVSLFDCFTFKSFSLFDQLTL